MITSKKLYGEELDKELAKRAQAKEDRRNQKLTLREASRIIGEKMGLTPMEYVEYEEGQDVCPHKVYEKVFGGIHPPFFIIERCKKCGKSSILRKIEVGDLDDKNEDVKEALKEAFENTFKK
jgi:hypothetical protein